MGRILAWGTSLLVLILVLELGLRLIGQAPPVRITAPDTKLGWFNAKDKSFHRKTSEFDVEFRFNSRGLRDDEIPDERPAGEKRILMLGDSFVLGYTVNREDHFVDLLEQGLNGVAPEGTSYQVINAGVEGFSTDQELLLLQRLHGQDGLVTKGDLVILCMYQNDLYWNDQPDYLGARKPLLPYVTGDQGLVDPTKAPELDGKRSSWLRRNSSLVHLLTPGKEPPRVDVPGVGSIFAEWGLYLPQEPPFITKARKRTEGILGAFRQYCEKNELSHLVALIPDKTQVNSKAARELAARFSGKGSPNPERATRLFADACIEVGIGGRRLLDPRNPLSGEPRLFDRDGEESLYYAIDWHFSPKGNRAFATALAHRLTKGSLLEGLQEPPVMEKVTLTRPAQAMTWPYVVGGLWILLSVLYVAMYRDENVLLAPLKIGLLLGFIVLMFAGIHWLMQVLPHGVASKLPAILVGLILLFVLFSVRKKIGTIFELFGAFIDRGHWYMVPLLTVLLSIGTLLIVAASNPFVAPFIYTLF